MIVPRRRTVLALLSSLSVLFLLVTVTRELYSRGEVRRMERVRDLSAQREAVMGEAEERSREDAVGRDDSGFRREYVKGVRLRRGLFIVLSKNLQR